MIAQGYSSGKVILSGEHSAVYDQPALVSGISLGVTVEVSDEASGAMDMPSLNLNKEFAAKFFQHICKIYQDFLEHEYPKTHLAELFQQKIQSVHFSVRGDLPIGVGLGSSAALAHAALRALIAFGADLSIPSIRKAEMLGLIQQSEQVVHGHPSGLDALGVVMGQLSRFQRYGDVFDYAPLVTTALESRQFFLIHSGQPQETTKEMIELVRQNRAAHVKIAEAISEMGVLTANFTYELEKNIFDPVFLTENERLLEEIGVVGEKAKKMIREIESVGGFAKITGAGGLTGGSGMLLVYHPEKEVLAQLIAEKAWVAYAVFL